MSEKGKKIEKCINQQLVQQTLLEKFITNYRKDGSPRRTKAYYEKRLKDFQKLWDDFQEGHKEIVLHMMSEEMESTHPYIKDDIFSVVQDFFLTHYTAIEDRFIEEFETYNIVVDKKENESTSAVKDKVNQNSGIQLPKIYIEKFNGDYSKWPTFHDLFNTMIHSNTSLSNVQKMQYLKLHIVGEPEQLLRHFRVTENNYRIAWDNLVERYNNRRVLVDTQLKMLLNQNSIVNESAQGIRNLLDTTFECLQALQNLEIDTQNWDPMIILLVVQRLPQETHKIWEQQISKNKELPTLKELKEFLEARFRTLEALNTKIPNKKDQRPNTSFNKNRSTTQNLHVSSTNNLCSLCNNGSHYLRRCTKFLSMAPQKRSETAREKGLCLNCLAPGHVSRECPSTHNCVHCGKRHHSLIHLKSNNTFINKENNTNTPNRNVPTIASNVQSNVAPVANNLVLNVETPAFTPPRKNLYNSNAINSLVVDRSNYQILLATTMVKIIGPTGKEGFIRALIDQGSQASFITENVVQIYRLTKESVCATVQGIGGEKKQSIHSRVRAVLAPVKQHAEINIEALVMKNLTNVLPSFKLRQQHWEHIEGLELADPHFYEPGKIDLLLGADVFRRIILPGLIKGEPGTPIAQQTIFGWILSGEVIASSSFHTTVDNFHLSINLERQIKSFWEVEEIENQNLQTEEEKKCEKLYEATTKRRKDGSYEVELPFNISENNYLGQSRNIALQRLYQLEYRFKNNSNLKKEYTKCLREYISLGHMRLVNSQELYTKVNNDLIYKSCYLPHHGVIKESSTSTKLRVVFDASKSTKSGKSLNDILLKGPTVQDELLTILIRWRKHKIAFTADIEKMYRQIWVKEPHSEYQRIVWREDTSLPVQDYKLLTVTFGTKSAPYLAIKTLQKLAQDESENCPIGCEIIRNDFYVDDLLSGGDTLQEALEAQQQIIKVTKSAGLTLKKWVANEKQLLKYLPDDHCEKLLPNPDDGTEVVRTLGLCWNPKPDFCSYFVNLDKAPPVWTKRKILSQIAKLFDPMGWLAPVIICAKIMMQKLWLSGLQWDDEVTQHLKIEWIKYFKNLNNIKNISVQRWLNYSTNDQTVELHAFADASMKAYAAVIYVCAINSSGIRTATLVVSKTKVAPIKTVSLPRLELCAVNLAAKLLKYVLTSLRLRQNVELYGWTDSEIALAWLKNIPSKWTTFVANRVAHVHDLIGKNIWNHVPTKQNPADAASRGMSPTELEKHNIWWHGPDWLTKSKNNWPNKRAVDTNLEQRKIKVNYVKTSTETFENNFSTLTKMIRVFSFCHRFIYNIKNKTQKRTGYLKAFELLNITEILIKRSQQRNFEDEIQSFANGNPISKKSSLLKLNPFLDDNGLLRVGGRLKFSSLPYTEKHPAILSEKDIFTKLLIDKVHRETLHGGPQLMLSVIRKQYWILNARNAIRFQIHKCIPCFRQKAETRTQLMGDLPKFRIQHTRPFLHTGLDYCGPFELKTYKGKSSKKYKAYIALFICMTIKAIHLEVVTDMSAEGFIAAFRRFCSRRGLCSDLYCDCGTNFVGASRILARQSHFLLSDVKVEVAEFVENEGVKFHFNPPASPHFGGLWEAGVRSTKYHLKRILQNNILTYEEFTTVTTQIEACLNSRPLCEMTNDPQDLSPLTPAHFLIGDSMLAPPQQSVLDIQMNRLDRWQHLQHVLQSFWKRWNSEYLTRLQQRPKWNFIKENIKIGDLVIVKDENLPPCRWLMARVIDTHPGSDGLVRVVTIKTKNTSMKRPVAKLCVLPIENKNLITSNLNKT